MRYRQLTADGDMAFGQGAANFWVDNVEAVAQAVLTRLRLLTGEWFLDTTEGLPLTTQIIGTDTASLYDAAIKARVLGSEGVNAILAYASEVNRDTRALTVRMTIDTIFGQATLLLEAVSGEIRVLATETGIFIGTDTGALIKV